MMLNTLLGKWSKLVTPKSLVVLFDETDVLAVCCASRIKPLKIAD
jgi:hypothetical protein